MRADPSEAARRLAARVPELARRLASRALEFARPRACALGGALLGLVADWYGSLAGLVIGSMLDEARAEAAARSAIAAFLRDPDLPFPPEPLAGLAAAAALALDGSWPGSAGPAEDSGLLERLALARLEGPALGGRQGRLARRRCLGRIIDLAPRALPAARPALARALATRGSGEARSLLADCAFGMAARAGRLGREEELAIRAALADAGLGPAELAAARSRAFPGYRDPWEVLGLPPGSSPAEVRRAYRRRSRELHPDARVGADACIGTDARVGADARAGDEEGAAFRELRAAYEELRAGRGAAEGPAEGPAP